MTEHEVVLLSESHARLLREAKELLALDDFRPYRTSGSSFVFSPPATTAIIRLECATEWAEDVDKRAKAGEGWG